MDFRGADSSQADGAPRERMSKGEREELIRLIKQRERVAKSAAVQRSAAMLAEFERQISAVHVFDKDDIWRAAYAAGVEAAKAAQAEMDRRSAELGIPEEFRPRLSFGWVRRGENEFAARRSELRKCAEAEIESVEAAARTQIEAQSVAAQTEVVAAGLLSDAARRFLSELPAIESFMPPLTLESIQVKLAAKARQDGRRPYLVES